MPPPGLRRAEPADVGAAVSRALAAVAAARPASPLRHLPALLLGLPLHHTPQPPKAEPHRESAAEYLRRHGLAAELTAALAATARARPRSPVRALAAGLLAFAEEDGRAKLQGQEQAAREFCEDVAIVELLEAWERELALSAEQNARAEAEEDRADALFVVLDRIRCGAAARLAAAAAGVTVLLRAAHSGLLRPSRARQLAEAASRRLRRHPPRTRSAERYARSSTVAEFDVQLNGQTPPQAPLSAGRSPRKAPSFQVYAAQPVAADGEWKVEVGGAEPTPDDASAQSDGPQRVSTEVLTDTGSAPDVDMHGTADRRNIRRGGIPEVRPPAHLRLLRVLGNRGNRTLSQPLSRTAAAALSSRNEPGSGAAGGPAGLLDPDDSDFPTCYSAPDTFDTSLSTSWGATYGDDTPQETPTRYVSRASRGSRGSIRPVASRRLRSSTLAAAQRLPVGRPPVPVLAGPRSPDKLLLPAGGKGVERVKRASVNAPDDAAERSQRRQHAVVRNPRLGQSTAATPGACGGDEDEARRQLRTEEACCRMLCWLQRAVESAEGRAAVVAAEEAARRGVASIMHYGAKCLQCQASARQVPSTGREGIGDAVFTAEDEGLETALEGQRAELFAAQLLAAAPEPAAVGVRFHRWLQGLAKEAGFGSSVASLSEAIAFAALAVAESAEQCAQALHALEAAWASDPPLLLTLQGGLAGATTFPLAPVPPASPGKPRQENTTRLAAEGQGAAARQMQGALEPAKATKLEPNEVDRRRRGLQPAFDSWTSLEWQLKPAPERSTLEEAAASFASLLRRTAECLERGDPESTNCRVVDFILHLPPRLHAALPSSKDWFQEEIVTTTHVYRSRAVWVPHRPGRWVRRETGLLSGLQSVLIRVAEQVQWANAHQLWSDPSKVDAQVRIEKKLDQEQGLKLDALERLVGDAKRDVHCYRTLLTTWDGPSVLEVTVAGFFYCTNLPKGRLPKDLADRNQVYQLFHIWNKALREYTDPEWPCSVSHEEKESNQRVVELFYPIAFLLTQLIVTLAKRGKPPIVSRGISVRISDRYETGTAVPLAQFTSTSTDDRTSLKFAGAAGSWMKLQVVNAAPVSFCSPYPGERELLLPPGTMTEVGFKFGGTLLMLLESQRDLIFLSEWSEVQRSTEETVEQRCRTLKDCSMLFEDFYKRFVEPCCDVTCHEGASSPKIVFEGAELFKVFRSFLDSRDVHLLVLAGGGGIGKSSSLVALMHQASQIAEWVPFFDGLHQIDRLLDRPNAPAVVNCYLHHLKRKVLQCRGADEALKIFLKCKVFHALDSLDEATGTIPKPTLLQSMGLTAGPNQKVGISTRPEYLEQQGIRMSHLHSGRVWLVQLKGFRPEQTVQYAKICARMWISDKVCTEKDKKEFSKAEQDAAEQRIRKAMVALRQDDDALATTPFAIKMVADLALADKTPKAAGAGVLKWHLVSEWAKLQVEQAAPRYAKLHQEPDVVAAQAVRVALALGVLLALTGEWQGVLAHFAEVLRRPKLLTDTAKGGGPEDRLPFSPGLGAQQRDELAAHVTMLLEGVPPDGVRDLLGVLPLRAEHLDSDSGLFSFRHKLVAEWVIALWFVSACAGRTEARPPAVAAKRFASPHCDDSYALLLPLLKRDPGLMALLGRLSLEEQDARRQARRRSTLLDPEMPMRLREMAEVARASDPLPQPAVDEGWVLDTFAKAVMQQYDVAGRGALSRRQVGRLWNVGFLGRADQPLTDDEWSGERQYKEDNDCFGVAPSILQAVELGRPGGHYRGAAAMAAMELNFEQVGAMLLGYIRWLRHPKHRNVITFRNAPCARLVDDPRYGSFHRYPCGLVRLWGAAASAARNWSLTRVAAQLCADVDSGMAAADVPARLGRRCSSQAGSNMRLQRLQHARLALVSRDAHPVPEAVEQLVFAVVAPTVSSTAESHAVGGQRGWLPARYAASAESAAAFRAACAARHTAKGAGDKVTQALLRHCWPGREGQWGSASLLLSGVTEMLRKERVLALSDDLRKGGERVDVAGLNPSAEQLGVLRRSAAEGGAHEVAATGCPRLAGRREAAALLHFALAGSPWAPASGQPDDHRVCVIRIDDSPVPEDVQEQIYQALQRHRRVARQRSSRRGLEGGVASAERAHAELCGSLYSSWGRRGGTAVKCIRLDRPYRQMNGRMLAELCAAARYARQGLCELHAHLPSVTETEWGPVAVLVRERADLTTVTIALTLAAPSVCDEICRCLTAREYSLFEDGWGKAGRYGQSQKGRENKLRHYGEL
eukprot:TRINITY_DN9525_c0_g3_i1.p1 TRINITY_DN9525_c0_g3~~TRINITY_DN9525_c0_g3_i1.p1  ORF type:complete len:2284 (+),score=471.92 TRINITY_DN9525_c0_g3_i1:79-6852(+)